MSLLYPSSSNGKGLVTPEQIILRRQLPPPPPPQRGDTFFHHPEQCKEHPHFGGPSLIISNGDSSSQHGRVFFDDCGEMIGWITTCMPSWRDELPRFRATIESRTRSNGVGYDARRGLDKDFDYHVPREWSIWLPRLAFNVQAVVKLFVRFRNIQTGHWRYVTGCAFRVSPKHFCTARHLVEAEMRGPDLAGYEVDQIGFSADTYYYLKRVATNAFPTNQGPCCNEEGATTPFWNLEADICFLEYTHNICPYFSCAFPIPPPSTKGDEKHDMVVGSTNMRYQAISTVMAANPIDPDDKSRDETAFAYAYWSISRRALLCSRALSIAPSCNIDALPPNSFTPHHCPSIAEFAGGLFLRFDRNTSDPDVEDAPAQFCGVHLGCPNNVDTGYNYALTTDHPSFMREYVRCVLLDVELEDWTRNEEKNLESYLQLIASKWSSELAPYFTVEQHETLKRRFPRHF